MGLMVDAEDGALSTIFPLFVVIGSTLSSARMVLSVSVLRIYDRLVLPMGENFRRLKPKIELRRERSPATEYTEAVSDIGAVLRRITCGGGDGAFGW